MATDLLKKFKYYLERFDYPNINFLDDEQAIDLFTIANRQVMLIWLMQNLSSTLLLPSDWKTAESNIADYLYENGFCKASHKHLFVRGDTTLSLSEEITIFERIFEYMSIIKQKNIPSITTPQYSIEQLINTDLNIFPNSGLPKPLNPSQKQEKINAYLQEISELEKINKYFNNSEGDEGDLITSSDYNIMSQIDLTEFPPKAKKIEDIALTINKINGTQTKEHVNGFNHRTSENLKTCVKETIPVIQYLKNLNIAFPTHKDLINVDNSDSEMLDLATRIYLLSSDGVHVLKNDLNNK